MKYLILLFVLLTLASTQGAKKYGRNCRNYNYSWSNLVLTWPGDFCRIPCNNGNWYKSWNGRSFSVHGLWPNSDDQEFISCISSGTDPNCDDSYPFSLAVLKKTPLLVGKLQNYWPDLNDNGFWSYEWNKHGVCYLNLLKRKTSQRNEAVFKGYFEKVTRQYETLTKNFRLTKGTYRSATQLLRDLGLNSNIAFPKCRKQNNAYYLSELYICYGLPNKTAGQEKIIPCPKINSNCNGPITLLGFTESRSIGSKTSSKASANHLS